MTVTLGAGPGGKAGRAGREAEAVKVGEALRGPAPPAGGVWHVPTFTVGQYHVRMRPQRHSLVLGLLLLERPPLEGMGRGGAVA